MIRINDMKCNATLRAAAVATVFVLFVAAAFGQQQINLTAAPTTTTMPDGTIVPMWGYFCGAAVTGSTASCAALNPASATNPLAPTWSPVVITVPTGQGLTINLTNKLSFTPTGSATANTIPTSIVIVGQVGGGLGGAPTTTASPSHTLAQGCPTWFIASGATPPGTPCPAQQTGASGTPPVQGPRVQSMATEVAAGATTALAWASLKPGTYLLESGTHPSIQVPMGLIGVLVVTTAPSGTTAGTAYPAITTTSSTGVVTTNQMAVTYNSELPLEFSEIDPVQNVEVNAAVNTAGFSETKVWSGMVGQCGNPNSPVGVVHTCYPPAVNYTPFYYLINGVAFSRTAPANSLFPATAGTAAVTNGSCTASATVSCPVTTGITGNVLVRLVNAGLRMHTPSIVGSQVQGFTGAGVATTAANPVSGFGLVAEDGNVLPNVATATTFPAALRVQTDVLMVPSKVYDVLINAPQPATVGGTVLALPIYARDLALSGNSSERDAGMLAYISVNNVYQSGNGLPVAAGTGLFAAALANNDTYNSLAAGQSFTVSDVSKGVIANDVNVYGVNLLSGPTSGTLTCPAASKVFGLSNAGICANGTFTYTPNSGSTATSDSFTYCANNGYIPAAGTTAASCSLSTLTATVFLKPATVGGAPTAANVTYTSNMATFIKIPSPGVLALSSDPSGFPLKVSTSTAGSGVTLNMDSQGGFTASVSGTGPATCPTGSPTGYNCYSFTYQLQNSQGTPSNTGTVTLVFPTPSNLKVNVLDAQLYNNCKGNSACISGITPLADYRWIIEEDQTFYVDPNCTTNSSILTPGCPTVTGPAGSASSIPVFGVNFHTSAVPFIAQGCTGPLSCEYGQTMLDTRPACTSPGVPTGCSATAGTHINAVCDVGNGACRPDTGTGTGSGGFTWVNPSEVHLDPSKRYYISVLPGDAANPFPSYAGQPDCVNGSNTSTTSGGVQDPHCGHTMSGAPIPAACNILGGANACTTASVFTQPVIVPVLPTPLPTGRLSGIVFEDDFPLNGEQDGGGGNGTVAPIEPGLGGFNIVLWDTYGGLGDVTGQDTYDMFNQPLSNALAGTIDPVTQLDACPISANPLTATGAGPSTGNGAGPAPATGMTGMIVTCPKYEADGATLSPLAGQFLVANLMPEKFSVQAYPAADRIARGEQWLQTNTLDGQHAHDSFIRIGEPSYFQEYGPAGYHVAIGFANPAIINARYLDVCQGLGSPGTTGTCTNTIEGQVDVERISRTPDQRLYPSGSRQALAWTQCWVSLGDPDGEDFMFQFCDANGNFKFTNVPGGQWRVTLGDQWNDQIIDGLSTPANVGMLANGASAGSVCPGTGSSASVCNLGNIGAQQWQSNLYTRTFIDANKNGIWDAGEIGIPFVYTMIHYRDGHNSNSLTTDFNGIANFNETYPLFNWYVVEADSGRYKTTGVHSVYDAGGPADGSSSCGNGTTARQCGKSAAYAYLSNTFEGVPLPADLSVPGAVYCANADCTSEANASYVNAKPVPSSSTASTGRIDPPWLFGGEEGWAGLTGLSNWIDFGKTPYCAGTGIAPGQCGATAPATAAENGGIHGYVGYASTRPFDDASQMIQQPWEPNVPRVTLNLYQEGFAADGVTPTLTLVDTTQSASWDDWAQGFWPGATAGGTGSTASFPYMNCPGQGQSTGNNADLFYFTLFDQPNYLDWYNYIHNGGTLHTLPYNSQYRCYDSMHIANQIQPAPYDGKYSFPSVIGINTATGMPVATKGCVGNAPGTACPTASVPGGATVSSMNGTNCTICVPNPDTTDKWRVGTPMLPPGKYVVQVMMPPGFEVYKEEDKNLLIGDNFIAPVTQQFGGLGTDIFIVPDQASVASLYDETQAGYNPTNYQDATTGLGLNEELSGVPGFPGFQDPLWPCVGEQRVVPDYLSLFPQAHEAGPFAGAIRPLCDRKEVMLANQMSVSAKFFIFTSTHIASKYTGGITDDLTSEFDPFSPQFGEKFAPPNLPVSTKDYLGNEISRVYADHWGTYDGLTFSSWEVNPPNITGYSPTIMVQCMNDPGPILDTNSTSPTYGQMITDPLYNPAYSNFCYENPYMPGLTTYLDTPVVPTTAFVGAGYNNVDCAYPDATPAIREVDTQDGVGPYMSAFGHSITITSLGVVQVNNSGYAGPSASAAPFNLKTVPRNYGFGSTAGTVTVGGVPLSGVSWTNNSITGTVVQSAVVNGATKEVPFCPIQQQSQYQGKGAWCGQLLITAANGQQSIDTVTVTIGGKAPTHVPASGSVQAAIDAAAPGDLIMVDPTCTATCTTDVVTTTTTGGVTTTKYSNAVASHNEMLIMWKPVRLQGVGAASSIINASAFPAGTLLDPWRRHINCLFGLTLQGVPSGNTTPYDSATDTANNGGPYLCPESNWQYFNATGQIVTTVGGVPTVTTGSSPQIDRLPLEAVVGWDATQNGNLAEQLQEPSLMGAFEGAGITVLAKGVDYQGANPWSDGNEAGAFPATTTMLTGVGPDPTTLPTGDSNPFCTDSTTTAGGNRFPSNFMCNPSSIDGLTITSSSQGGGGIFAHGWAHHLQIANNRIYNNAGTLTGGISIGQGEFPTPYVFGSTTNAAPGSCSDGTGFQINQHLPYCLQIEVNVHNNMVTTNSSLGDELFSGTLAGGGGATFCTGNDYYKFNYNWVCGNLSSGEGGGLVHLGEIQNGDIEHNSIVFNQSTNPDIPSNGGAIMVQGTPDTDPVCGVQIDADCPPGLSDGTGHGLVINANLIQGNMAESGAGAGIRLQQVNGSDVSTFPSNPEFWNDVAITNNIIVNNVAGWDGGGISLQDALKVQIINNTIAKNDTLASSGVLTQSIGTPDSSAPAGSCVQTGPTGSTTASCPQPSGLSSTLNSKLLTTTFTGLTITCPFGLPSGGPSSCLGISNPLLMNNLIYQNRSFHIGISGAGTGNQNQQNLVTLFSGGFTSSGGAVGGSTLAGSQASTGACSASDTFWDIGVRTDSGPSNHASGFQITNNGGEHNSIGDTTNPRFTSQYCNGSRVPPECTLADGCGGPNGYGVPPGIVDASSPNPVFTMTPNATVDEGNNWINVSWGPLTSSSPSVQGPDGYGTGLALGNYSLLASSPAIDAVPYPESVPTGATFPTKDFFGNPRPEAPGDGHTDYGAVEFQGTKGTVTTTLTSISPNSGVRGTSVNVTLNGTNLTGTSAINLSGSVGSGITVTGIANVSATQVVATFNISSTGALGSTTVTVTDSAGTTSATGAPTFMVTAAPPTVTGITPPSGPQGARVSVTITGTNLNGATVSTPAGGGITVSGTTVNPAGTSLTTTFTIAATATLGAQTVTVVTTSGAATTSFTVTAPLPPTVTGITPGSGPQGARVSPVTITGTNLTGAAVTVSGTGVAVSGTTVNAAGTSLATTFTISGSATLGARTVTVTTAGGTATTSFTVTAGLTISGPVPALCSNTTGTGGCSAGTATTATKTGVITVMNAATATASFAFATTPSITKVSGPGTFSIVAPATGTQCTATTNLAAGASCTIGVQYAPGTSTSNARANVTVTGTGGVTYTSANFTGN